VVKVIICVAMLCAVFTGCGMGNTPVASLHEEEWFSPILNAYAVFELSNYTVHDDEIMGNTFWSAHMLLSPDWNEGNRPPFLYALHDLNGDGVPELMIGGEYAPRYGLSSNIFGIYALQNNSPTSVFNQTGSRYNLSVQLDDEGNCILSNSWGHLGTSEDYFYKIDEDGQLVLLNYFQCGVVFNELNEATAEKQHYRHVGDEFVRITEEECLYFMRKYGSSGHLGQSELLEQEERTIQLEWSLVEVQW